MSIDNSYIIQIIESDGETKKFNFNFFVFNREEVKIKIIDNNNNIRELEYEIDYIVENKIDYSNGGWLELNEATEEGNNICIYRQTEITQQIDLLYLQTLNPQTLTAMFDKLTAICQELNDEFYRSFKFDFEPLSIIDQTQPLNEYNIHNLPDWNTTKIVALALKYNEDKQKWQLYTTTTDPDTLQKQITENTNNIEINRQNINRLDNITAGHTTKLEEQQSAINTLNIKTTQQGILIQENRESIEENRSSIAQNRTDINKNKVDILNLQNDNQTQQEEIEILKDISAQQQEEIEYIENNKQDKLTAGKNIKIVDNVIFTDDVRDFRAGENIIFTEQHEETTHQTQIILTEEGERKTKWQGENYEYDDPYYTLFSRGTKIESDPETLTKYRVDWCRIIREDKQGLSPKQEITLDYTIDFTDQEYQPQQKTGTLTILNGDSGEIEYNRYEIIEPEQYYIVNINQITLDREIKEETTATYINSGTEPPKKINFIEGREIEINTTETETTRSITIAEKIKKINGIEVKGEKECENYYIQRKLKSKDEYIIVEREIKKDFIEKADQTKRVIATDDITTSAEDPTIYNLPYIKIVREKSISGTTVIYFEDLFINDAKLIKKQTISFDFSNRKILVDLTLTYQITEDINNVQYRNLNIDRLMLYYYADGISKGIETACQITAEKTEREIFKTARQELTNNFKYEINMPDDFENENQFNYVKLIYSNDILFEYNYLINETTTKYDDIYINIDKLNDLINEKINQAKEELKQEIMKETTDLIDEKIAENNEKLEITYDNGDNGYNG